jgi:hypothetical protein
MLKKPFSLKNDKGMAALEMIPILLVIVLFVNFSIGFFGVIHSGILNSIAARNYAFETFRNRSNLTYFRINPNAEIVHYARTQLRLHGTISEQGVESGGGSSRWIATTRVIDFMNFDKRVELTGDPGTHNNKTREVPVGRNTAIAVNPVWIKTMYGICLTAACGS